jgi:hypothetical protein
MEVAIHARETVSKSTYSHGFYTSGPFPLPEQRHRNHQHPQHKRHDSHQQQSAPPPPGINRSFSADAEGMLQAA